MKSWPKPAREATLSIIFVIAFAASAAFSTAFTRDQNGVEAIWLSTGFLSAALLLLKPRWAIPVAVACVAAKAAILLAAGDSPLRAGLLSGIELVIAGATAWLGRLALGPALRITALASVVRLLGLAVAPSAAVGTLMSASVAAALGGDFDAVLGSTFYVTGLGTALILPPMLLVLKARSVASTPFWERASIYAGFCGFATLATHYTSFPIHLLLFPGAILVAFRLGRRGVGAATLLVTAIEAVGIVVHPASGLNVDWTVAERMHMMTFIVALCFCSSLATALALSSERRIRQLWAGRSRIARRAESRARAAQKAKDEFLATMSHEIRTPMHAIVGFADVLLKRDDLPDPAHRQVDLIARAGASLMTTVDDILTFSELQSRGISLKPKPYSLKAVTEDALAIVTSAARQKRLALDLTVSGHAEAPVMIDELRVRQVLLNLLGNAIKFTEAGRVRVDLQHDPEHARVRFTVTDTGIGIPDDKLGRLFKPFSQIDSSTTRTVGGAGLGLAIAKALVEIMGGQIGVEPGLAQGAAFWFEIPALPAEQEPAVEAPAETALAARVLLVDDNASNRELGLTVLRLLGCDVHAVEDGRQAVAAMQTSLYDLVLMDVHMPQMDGLDATRAIRALGGEAARTPIIAMSADVTPEMTRRCAQSGMADALEKPVNIAALHGMLNKWIGRSADPAPRAA